MAAARSASAPSLAGGNVRGVLTALCRRALQALGLGLVAAAGAIVVALSGYDPADPSWNHATDAVANNPLGGVGAHLADALLQSFGYAAYVVPFALACWGVRLIIQVPLAWPWLPVMALPFALLLTALYLAPKPVGLDWTLRTGYGGFVGDFLLFRVPPDATGQEIRLTSGLLALVALAATMGLRWREVGRLLATIGRAIARLAAGTGRGTAELWRRRGEFAPERPPWRRVDDEPEPEAEPSRLAFAEGRLSPSGFEVVGRLLAR